MGEAMNKELNSATRDPLRAAGLPLPHTERRPDIRAAHRLHGLMIAVGSSLVLWGAIVAVVWLVGIALT
ncbi:hypothetical protein ABIB15_001401 [Marisediminicola sp. UYEF4]|uniref:hypothetical protein n=1 Tax=Marisediminicola sp. UYEF4 TaxID=1756384 RepID=UPI00339B5CA4